jgi:hypothetical protein
MSMTFLFTASISLYTWLIAYDTYRLVLFICSTLSFLIGLGIAFVYSYKYISKLLIENNNNIKDLSVIQIQTIIYIVFGISLFVCQISIMIGYYIMSEHGISLYISAIIYVKNGLAAILIISDTWIKMMYNVNSSNKIVHVDDMVIS